MAIDPRVPRPASLEAGTAGQSPKERDTAWDKGGTLSLKALARKVLERDTAWDKGGTPEQVKCPTAEIALGHAASQMAAPARREPIDWASDYEKRVALREYDGYRSRAGAERLAWGEMQNEWHRLHGKTTPSWQCAGCGNPIGGQPVFAFPDGARAHDSLDCIAAYGKRWRSAATAALVVLGLPRPASVPEDT